MLLKLSEKDLLMNSLNQASGVWLYCPKTVFSPWECLQGSHMPYWLQSFTGLWYQLLCCKHCKHCKKNPFQRNLWPYTIIKMLSDRYSICVLNFITAAVWFLRHILYYSLVLPLGIRWHFYTPALICCFIAVSDFLKWVPKRCLESESSVCLGSKFDPVSSKSNHLSQILSNSGPGLLKLSFAELSLSIWLHRNQAKLGP